MSHTITLFSGYKKKNSTKRVTTGGTDYSCNFKHETSVLNPTVVLNVSASSISTKSIAYIGDFNRYYFINDIRSIRTGVCEVDLTNDPMATFKAQIGASNQYIKRASEDYNTLAYDDEVEATFEFTHEITQGSTTVFDDSNMFYVIAVSGVGVSTYTGGMTWIITEDLQQTMMELNDVENIAPNDIPGQQIAQWILDQITNAVFNPKDYIMSIRAYSRAHGKTLGSHDIMFGLALAHLTNCYITNNPLDMVATFTDTLAIPNLEHNDFRKYNESITIASLFLPGAGVKNIPMNQLDEGLILQCVVDYSTGDAKYLVYNSSNNRVITTVPTTFGADVQWSAGRNIGQTVVDTGINYMETAKSLMVQPTNIIGNYSGLSYLKDYRNFAILMILQKKCAPLPYHIKGRPVNKYKTINQFSSGSYIECLNPSIEIPGFDSEIETINNYLESGFYYE